MEGGPNRDRSLDMCLGLVQLAQEQTGSGQAEQIGCDPNVFLSKNLFAYAPGSFPDIDFGFVLPLQATDVRKPVKIGSDLFALRTKDLHVYFQHASYLVFCLVIVLLFPANQEEVKKAFDQIGMLGAPGFFFEFKVSSG